MRAGATLISFIWPAQNPALLEKLQAQKVTAIAMDAVPRISRAQSMDALSAMANISGYRAIIEAAHEFGRFLAARLPQQEKSLRQKLWLLVQVSPVWRPSVPLRDCSRFRYPSGG